ncbi:hypothetical protein ACHAWF_014194 [Thalassiosira exigua]
MEPQAQEVGRCQNHGVGKGAYNSIEVLGCTDRCLCFKQVAAMDGDANCDTSKAVGWNVKMSCFDQCLVDCNGIGCGETATVAGSRTRLMLTGSGPICATQTTGMVLDENGDVVDTWADSLVSRGSSIKSSLEGAVGSGSTNDGGQGGETKTSDAHYSAGILHSCFVTAASAFVIVLTIAL